MFNDLLKIKWIVLAVLILTAAGAVAEDSEMEPAPSDRARHQYRREPGQFKRNKYGLIDPSPDVVSLKFLPTDAYGFVDWMKAIKDGVIAPKDTLGPGSNRVKEEDKVSFDKDILIRAKQDFMPDVIFPHSAHNAWLKCSICHPKIFRMKAGGNPISMVGIWKGQFCGRCHDKVAFPTRNCFKCHSAPRRAKARN